MHCATPSQPSALLGREMDLGTGQGSNLQRLAAHSLEVTSAQWIKRAKSLKRLHCLSALCLIAFSTEAATITVTNTSDSGAGSLRHALADAVDGDMINFNSSLNGQTITLTSGQLVVNESATISGPGADQLAVDANDASRVFYIASGKDVTISRLTITDGLPPISEFGRRHL